MGAALGSLAGIGSSIGGMSMSMASCVACQACSCASSVVCSYLCGYVICVRSVHKALDVGCDGVQCVFAKA